MRDVLGVDVNAEQGHAVLPQEQPEAEHRQGPDVADQRHTRGRHGQLQERTDQADECPSGQDDRAPAAPVTRDHCLSGSHAGWPGGSGGEQSGVKGAEEHPGVHEQTDRGAEPPARQERVGGTERGAGDRALDQVLPVDRSHLLQSQQVHPPDQHRDQRADDRGVGRDAQCGDQVEPDEGSENGQGGGEGEGDWLERPRMVRTRMELLTDLSRRLNAGRENGGWGVHHSSRVAWFHLHCINSSRQSDVGTR